MKPEEELELIIGMHYNIPKNYVAEHLGIKNGRRYKADEDKKKAVDDYLGVINPYFDVIFYRFQNIVRGIDIPAEQEEEYERAVEEIRKEEKEPLWRISMHFGVGIEELSGIERKIQELKRQYRRERRSSRQEA